MKLPEVKGTDVLRIPLSVNGSFQETLELTGAELVALQHLIEGGVKKDVQTVTKPAPATTVQKPPEGTKAGDQAAEQRVQPPKTDKPAQ